MLLVNSSVRKSPRQLIFHMVPHNHIWKKICESIFEIKSAKKYWKKYSKKIYKEYLSKNLLWEKRDKVFKAFIALSEALDNSSVSKNPRQLIFYMVPHNHIWKKICEKIFERKSEKEYSKEIPRKNSWAKSREKFLEKKSMKQFLKKICELLLRSNSLKAIKAFILRFS